MWRFLLCLVAAVPVLADGPWLRLTTPDFELYTSAGEKTGRETILHFEQVRAFFLKASPVKATSDFPVRVIQFGSATEFQRYSSSQFAAAFFTSTPARDYIVLGDPATAGSSAAIHEYMHLVIRHSGLRIPIWLNEGWSDVYSTLRPMGKEAAIGDLLPGWVQELDSTPWMDFKSLTTVDRNSPEYNEAARAGIFYSESWALAHMLYFAPEYEANFSKFVMALHQGHSAAEACEIAWGRSSAQVFGDLKKYLDRKKIYGRAYDLQLEKEKAEPAVSPLTAFDQRLMLADLLAATNHMDEAKREYARLKSETPDSAAVSKSLGYLAWRSSDPSGAAKYFVEAYNEGETDSRMCFQLAEFMLQAREPPKKIVPVLERAVRSQPNYSEARVELGVQKIRARDFSGGVAILIALPTVRPDVAAPVFCGLTVGFVETGDLESARSNLTPCGNWSKTPAEKAMLEWLSRLVDARSREDAGVHPGEKLQTVVGVVQAIDCAGTLKQLRIRTPAGVQAFDLPAWDAVEMLPDHGGSFDKACGVLKPVQIAVQYAPPGIVRTIEY